MVEERPEDNRDGLLDRMAYLLGVDKKYVIPGIATCAISAAAIVFLAVAAIADLRSQFFGDPANGETASRIEMLAEQPVSVKAGEPLPAEGEDGSADLCGEELFGAAGWERGWVWDSEDSVCRRVSGSLDR